MKRKANEWILLDVIFGTLGVGAIVIVCAIVYTFIA